MRAILLGAAGFIGTNLAIKLSEQTEDVITLVDREESYFNTLKKLNLPNVEYLVSEFDENSDFDH